MRDALGGASYFLGVFDGNGHANLGDSDEWADVDRFAEKAIALAADHLGLRRDVAGGRTIADDAAE